MQKNILLTMSGNNFLYRALENVCRNNVNIKFENIITYSKLLKHDGIQQIGAQDIYNQEDKLLQDVESCLSGEEIDFYQKNCYYEFSSQLDRLSLISKPIKEYQDLFYFSLNYYKNILIKKNITHIIFQTTPHLAIDYLLFHVAKKNNIKTIIFFRTFYEDTILIAEDYRNKFFQPHINKDHLSNKNFEEKIVSAWTKVGKKINNNSLNKRLLTKLGSLFWIFANNLRNILNNKLQSPSIIFLNKKINIFQFSTLFIKNFFRTVALKKMYKKISGTFDYQKINYIYFALHNQPEKTTQPEGQSFDSQLNAIRYLSEIVPSDWKILIKEHPKQLNPFSGDLRQIHTRTIKDYKRLLKIKNCSFIALDEKIETLIKSSKLNATITGTVAWESLLHNKPSLSFANTWHSSCKASPIIFHDKEQARTQVQELCKMSEKEVSEEVNNFEKNISKYLFEMPISDYEFNESSTSKEILKQNAQIVIEDILKI